MKKILYLEDSQKDIDTLIKEFKKNTNFNVIPHKVDNETNVVDLIISLEPDYIIVDLSVNDDDANRMEAYIKGSELEIPAECPGDFCGGMKFIEQINQNHRKYLTHDLLAILTWHHYDDGPILHDVVSLAEKWWRNCAPKVFSKIDEIENLKLHIESKLNIENKNRVPKRFFCVTNEEAFADDVTMAVKALELENEIDPLIIVNHQQVDEVFQTYSTNQYYDFAIIDITLTQSDEKLFDNIVEGQDLIENLNNLEGVKLLTKIKQINENTIVIAAVKTKKRNIVRLLMEKYQTPAGEWVKRVNFVIPIDSFELSIFGTLLHFIE